MEKELGMDEDRFPTIPREKVILKKLVPRGNSFLCILRVDPIGTDHSKYVYRVVIHIVFGGGYGTKCITFIDLGPKDLPDNYVIPMKDLRFSDTPRFYLAKAFLSEMQVLIIERDACRIVLNNGKEYMACIDSFIHGGFKTC